MASQSTNRKRATRGSHNGRSASQKPSEYRFAHNVAGTGTVKLAPGRLSYAAHHVSFGPVNPVAVVSELQKTSGDLPVSGFWSPIVTRLAA